MGLTKAGGVGGTGGTGGTTGVTGGVGVTGAVAVDEPPPHPAKNASGRIKEARILEIFMVVSRYSKIGIAYEKCLGSI
jgi:hypothetical protein